VAMTGATLTRVSAVPRCTATPAPSEPDGLRIPRTGLTLPQQLSFEKWLGIGRQLSAVVTSSAWCLGDWLVFGESAYNGRYREAIEQTSLDYKTLRNYAWVTRRFPLSRRRDSLSFGHHAEVAALPECEQDYWLRKAEDRRWSRNQLRREVRASLGARSPEDGLDDGHALDGVTDRDGCEIQLKFTPGQLELYAVAATRAGVSVEDWAVQALDQAARHG
jgi:hypothetical protein